MNRFYPVAFLQLVAAAGMLLAAATNAATIDNPSPERVEKARNFGPCRDPWITLAIWHVTAGIRQPAGIGDSGECDPKLYGGNWGSFNELLAYVETARNSMRQQRESFSVLFDARHQANSVVVRIQNGLVVDKQTVPNQLVGPDGGTFASKMNTMVAAGAGNVIVNNGGNIVESAGSHIVAAGAGNIVAAGAGNIVVAGAGNMQAYVRALRTIPSFSVSPGTGYGLLSKGSTRLPKSTITHHY